MTQLADDLGVSERHLRRRVSTAVGYGPKRLARVIRLGRALQAAHVGEDLARVALEAGYADQAPSELTSIPNVGPAVERKLNRLGVARPEDLRGRDPEELFERLCAPDGLRHDPCLLDTVVAAVSYADGKPGRPWWEFSRDERRGGHG